MRTNKDDYSALVYAIQEGNEKQVRDLLEELLDRLIDYVRVRFRTDDSVAQEVVQQVITIAIQQINDDKIRKPESIFSYLLRSCRREYYRLYRDVGKFESVEESNDAMTAPPGQYDGLLDEERQRILEECLEELENKEYDFMEYVIDKPEASTIDLSEQFDVTEANARTLKYRLIKKLNKCVGRKYTQ